MYKLLTTAAVIMTVATPSIADQWTGGQKLISDLGAIYGGVGGGADDGVDSHFNVLQRQDGALSDFLSTAGQGVTHITLNVSDGTDGNELNTISVGVNQGTTLDEIKTAQGNLINQINYDLFVDTDVSGAEDYTGTPTNPGGIGLQDGVINPADGSTDYAANLGTGLVGFKVAKVVADVNAVNDYLVADGRTKDEADAIVAGIAADATLNGIDGLDGLSFNTDIAGLNTSITTAANTAFDFFGNVNDAEGLLGADTLSSFQITGFTGTTVNDGTNTFPTLLDWANGTNGVPN